MAVSLTHTFVSSQADGGDATLVRASNWNAQHTVTLASGAVLGRTTAGTGAAEEITATAPITLSGGTLGFNQAAIPPGAVVSGSSAGAMMRITQTGAGAALLIEDSANPDSTPLVVDAAGNVGSARLPRPPPCRVPEEVACRTSDISFTPIAT